MGNVVVRVGVRSTGDGGGEEPVEEEGESVMDSVDHDGGEVIPRGLLGGLSLVVRVDISSLDIEESDQLVGGLLQSSTGSPGTDSGNESGEEIVVRFGVLLSSINFSEGLVHLPCNGEGGSDDPAGETDVHDNPHGFGKTHNVSSP